MRAGRATWTLAAPPGVSLPDYQRSLIQRFRNPAIDDRLLRLAQDTCEKFRQALLPPLQQRLECGAKIDSMATAVALLLQYLPTLSRDATTSMAYHDGDQIGRDKVRTPATNALIDCRLPL